MLTVAAIAPLVAAIGLGAAAPAAAEVNRVSNAYQYVSDGGRAEFTIPWRGAAGGAYPGLTLDGTLLFWTQPGAAGTAIDYTGPDVHRASTTGTVHTLPAFAADESTTPIGTWTIPAGTVYSATADARVVLQLDDGHIDFAGPIRPLKMSLDAADPVSPHTFANSGSGTIYPLTLARTDDVTVGVLTGSGTVPIDVTAGSCFNTTTAPNAVDGETLLGSCQATSLTLVDAAGDDVQTLPLLDPAGGTVGAWAIVTADGVQTVRWTYDDAVVPVQPVRYRLTDVRGPGWSGWWGQEVTNTANTRAGAATYDIATITPVIATPASATDGVAETLPGAEVSVGVPYAAGTLVAAGATALSPASVTDITVVPDDATLGTWSVAADGALLFQPAPGAVGVTAAGTYTVTSSNGTTASAALTVRIAASPDTRAAVASGAAAATRPGTSVTLSPAYDAGTQLTADLGRTEPASVSTFTITAGDPSLGTWERAADGGVRFTPAAGVAARTATATYAVTSSNGSEAHADLAVTIGPAIVPASAADASASTRPGIDVILTPVYAAGTIATDDPAVTVDAIVTAVSVDPADPTHGAWTVLADGSIRFTPGAGVHDATVTATYRVSASNGTDADASLTVTVTAGAPTASASAEPQPTTSTTTSSGPRPSSPTSAAPRPLLPDTGSETPMWAMTSALALLAAGAGLLGAARRRRARSS